jgi:hypothetical protein
LQALLTDEALEWLSAKQHRPDHMLLEGIDLGSEH